MFESGYMREVQDDFHMRSGGVSQIDATVACVDDREEVYQRIGGSA
jgi:sigma54-dependent transcription regulator